MDSTITLWERRLPSTPQPTGFRASLAFLRGEWETADSIARAFLRAHAGNPALAVAARQMLAQTAATRGRLAEARRHWRDVEADQARRGLPAEALGAVLDRAWMDVVARDAAGAVQVVEAGLETYPLEAMDALDRPYPGIVFSLVDAGRGRDARRYLREWEAAEPGVENREVYWQARAAVESLEGDLEAAVQHYRRGDSGECTACVPYGLARAYDAAGRADSALVLYERFLSTGMLFRAFLDAGARGATLERLAQLYDAKGDLENAAKYYAMFVELWAEADPELQPRVRAAQARLEAIVAERG